MRRSASAFAVTCIVTLAVAPTAAFAVGPGGWNHVGVGSTSTTPPLNGKVYALNTDNPGVLYAGGSFTSAGGHPKARYIARWDGSSWSALGSTPLTTADFVDVRAIAYHAGKVYVGGTFQNAGGHGNADFLAVWDGSNWGPACNRTSGSGSGPAITATVQALQIVGNTLWVGGSFGNGGGIDSADSIVGCDLTTKDPVSPLVDDGNLTGGAVYALTADSNGILYAGGAFINLNGIAAADHVAAYNGSGWAALGGTDLEPAVDDFVRSLTAVGTNVYVGTDATDVAGIAKADHVARWDGSAWHAMGSDSTGTNGWFDTSTFIYGLAHSGSLIIAAGSFQNADGIARADEIAYWDGFVWHALGSNGAGNGPLDSQANAVAVGAGQVYAGGNFSTAGGDSLAGSLAAYGLRLPDAQIGGAFTGPYVGNNVYSTTGAGEVRHVTITRGTTATSYVRIQNDGLVTTDFKVRGTGDATGISVHYYLGATSITAAVRAGTYATVQMTPGDATTLRVVVTVAHSSAGGVTLVTTARSQAGTPPDAARLVVSATG